MRRERHSFRAGFGKGKASARIVRDAARLSSRIPWNPYR